MELLVLVLFFIILGYFLGASSLSDEADRTTERVAVASKRWIDRLDHRVHACPNLLELLLAVDRLLSQ